MGIDKKKTYEERFYDLIRDYTTQDIERIIDAGIQAAGLIIMPALVGMIALGNSLYGHDLDDRAAFLKFARYRMKLDRGFAEILYDNVYAGLIRMWCSEVRVVLHSRFVKGYEGPLWYRDRSEKPQKLHVSAQALAIAYVEAVEKLPEYLKTAQHKNDDKEATAPLRSQVETFCSSGRVQNGGAVWQ